MNTGSVARRFTKLDDFTRRERTKASAQPMPPVRTGGIVKDLECYFDILKMGHGVSITTEVPIKLFRMVMWGYKFAGRQGNHGRYKFADYDEDGRKFRGEGITLQSNLDNPAKAAHALTGATLPEAREFAKRLTIIAQENGSIPPGWEFRVPTREQFLEAKARFGHRKYSFPVKNWILTETETEANSKRYFQCHLDFDFYREADATERYFNNDPFLGTAICLVLCKTFLLQGETHQ